MLSESVNQSSYAWLSKKISYYGINLILSISYTIIILPQQNCSFKSFLYVIFLTYYLYLSTENTVEFFLELLPFAFQ